MKFCIITITALLLTMVSADAKQTCKKMKNCEEACRYFLNGDRGLDRDKDGIPCENVCHKPCKKSGKNIKKRSKK